MTRAGSDAQRTPCSGKAESAYLGRTVRRMKKRPGVTASRSDTSSPIRRNGAPSALCLSASGKSITTVSTGKFGGKVTRGAAFGSRVALRGGALGGALGSSNSVGVPNRSSMCALASDFVPNCMRLSIAN